MVEGNGARSEGVWGAELGLGYQVTAGGFSLRPIGGVLVYQGDNERYFTDTFNNGQTRCRDRTNGQFADDRLCDDTALKPYGKLEASYTVAGSLELGGGGRYDGGAVRPYGLVSFPIAPRFRVHGNVGEEFFALGLRGAF
ncbi:hypothetical protein A9D12_07195 [Erythrobacter neustonensis]|uniref:Bacterial surface antigen (D15) domain-containing protein n=1 Tax=Erythrobacter neustonensis TaxID=1112 RepID=A0A192D6Q5_9SPHN|nr:hypothetical protein A9D12_07195 [Erythrobacter neustonensis]